ncbi:trigger factor [Erythromicrobium ramosum]|uniref:Trigger factor n=1 Tax=Erythrobacter ramosus TaxID=35811 RepID=A0A6I4UDM5_9SPHN|nr:trigger factor [Erythrobacter ramosus]MBB3775358.1 trigger factor [Erythrobacter ramosus]MXP37022.1 trigger factor [Erythrobacter ramosus]
MQTKQTVNEGLKRAYLITIPAADLTAKIDAEIKKVAPQVRMPGFRPGKVPANLVKKMHGEALHGQVVNDTIRESVDKLLRDEALRPAMQPEIGLNDDYEQGKDAQITVSLEVLPAIEAPSLDGLKLEKLVVPVTDAQIDEALGNIASQNKSYKDAPKTKKAADGDQLIIDFVGKLDGVEFDGGKAEDAALVIGSGTFIPGFEDQLVGVKTGAEKTITVTFPADYQAEHLAGKDATFDITVKAVKVETETTLDEEFAKSLGLDSLDKLKEIMKAQLEQQTAGLTRTQMKRALLDQLAAGHSFEVPGTMVAAEFEQIWAQLQQEAARDEDPAGALKQIEDEKDEYRAIAERRVRLGLLLSEIGQANGVEVTQQEMSMLIQQAAMQYRNEDRERFVQYIQSEPMAAAQLRAPLYEDKVVDFLFDKAEVTEREVTVEELQAAIEAEDGAEAAPAPKKVPAKKKAPAKKAEAAAEEAPASEEKPAKKAPAKKKADAPAEAAEAKPAAAKKAPAKKAEAAAEEKPAAKKAPAKKAAAKK